MDYETKLKIIDEIKRSVDVFKPVPPIRYRIRCPICGDSQKDLTDSHCYIKCSRDPDEPLTYYCFLANCNAYGAVNKYFLDKLGVNSEFSDQLQNQRYNRIANIKKTDIDIITGDPIMDSAQVCYIEDRLGKGLTFNDYNRFKIVWDISTLLPYISNERTKNILPSNHNSISFLSDDKSTLLTRTWNPDYGWHKTKIFNSGNRIMYTIKTTLDLFTSDRIVVNIAEGIFDILSVYKNFNDCDNSVFIAILGPDYESGIIYAMQKGFIGSNIDIKIYIDDNIDVKILKNKLKKYKWIYNSITLFKNIKYKDVGTTIDRIVLREFSV